LLFLLIKSWSSFSCADCGAYVINGQGRQLQNLIFYPHIL